MCLSCNTVDWKMHDNNNSILALETLQWIKILHTLMAVPSHQSCFYVVNNSFDIASLKDFCISFINWNDWFVYLVMVVCSESSIWAWLAQIDTSFVVWWLAGGCYRRMKTPLTDSHQKFIHSEWWTLFLSVRADISEIDLHNNRWRCWCGMGGRCPLHVSGRGNVKPVLSGGNFC